MTGEIVHWRSRGCDVAGPSRAALRLADHAEQLAEHAPVVIDVLEDVENSDCIIVPRDGKVTRIGLDEWHVRKPRTRGAQPIRIEIGSGDVEIRPPGVQLREDEAIAASDLEEAVDLREVAGERPLDQAAARSEPEAIGFQVREWFERAPRIGGSRVDTGLVCEECNIAATLREQPGPISVVVPVYGDGRALGDLTTRLQRVLEPIAPWELILVNDGSPPPAWDRICHLASSHTFVKALDLQRNAGQHSALLAGIRASTGDVVVTMDDDLQHPPEAILDLLRQLHESGDDVVYGTPCEPVHGQRRQFGGRVARWIVAFVSGVPQAQVVSAFRAFRGTLREAFAVQEGPLVFIDGVLCRVTGKVSAVPVPHEPRRHGRSGYGVRRLIGVAVAMTAAFGIPRARLFLLVAAGGVSVAAGVALWRRSPAPPSIAAVLSGTAIGLGCVLLGAGIAFALLVRGSAVSRRGSGYAVRTSINLELP